MKIVIFTIRVPRDARFLPILASQVAQVLIGAIVIPRAQLAAMQIHVPDNALIHVQQHARDTAHAIRHVPILILQAFARQVIHVSMSVLVRILAIRTAPILTGATVMQLDQLVVLQIHVQSIAWIRA